MSVSELKTTATAGLTLRREKVPFSEYYDAAYRAQILPDFWRQHEPEARVVHEGRIYLALRREDDLLGWFWVQSPWPGYHRAELGSLVFKRFRGTWSRDGWPLLIRLLSHCFAPAAAGGFELPRLSAIFEQRRPQTEKFYRKLGFDFEGRHYDYETIHGRPRTMITLGLTAKRFALLMERGLTDGPMVTGSGSRPEGGRRDHGPAAGREP